jgi:uncharacterized protein DUF4365
MPSRSTRRRKKIHRNVLLGQEGINIIEEAVLKMGFVWSPMGAIEAGIDGTIEIRDPETGEMLHSIIRVQSKATSGPFVADSGQTFEYLCDERDLDYWLRGNAPVILVRSRSETREAYWVSIKDYFRDPERRKTRKVVFNKDANRFDVSAAGALRNLAVPADLGAYFAPAPKREVIYSNMLRVTRVPTRLFHGVAIEHGSREAIREVLQQYVQFPYREWVTRGKTVLSVHDLSQHPWNTVVDAGTVEEFAASEWADGEDEQKRRDFVELLNYCLAEMLGPAHVRYHEKRGFYYFAATPDLTARTITYTSVKQKTEKEVFGPRQNKKDPDRVAYYRHSAFVGQFVRHDAVWFLEIEPTYHFTFDGKRGDRYSASRLTGIKRLERNPSVLGQLHMWVSVLAPPNTLFRKVYPNLEFGDLKRLDLPCGIDDAAWLKREDEPLPPAEIVDQADTLWDL